MSCDGRCGQQTGAEPEAPSVLPRGMPRLLVGCEVTVAPSPPSRHHLGGDDDLFFAGKIETCILGAASEPRDQTHQPPCVLHRLPLPLQEEERLRAPVKPCCPTFCAGNLFRPFLFIVTQQVARTSACKLNKNEIFWVQESFKARWW